EAERRAATDAQPLLQQAADVRKDHVRSRRADEHEIDVGGLDPGAFDRGNRRAIGEIAGRLVLADDVAALDARARAYPFVGRVDHLLEVEVGQDLFGEIRPGADYARIHSCG